LVRKAKTEGPQHITVHGREEVVLVSVEEYRRVRGEHTGLELVNMLRDSPLGDLRIERASTRDEIRGVDL
jgi:PHD/YefM family antitoxin component YafN of YafNO toxin-antitoxin module